MNDIFVPKLFCIPSFCWFSVKQCLVKQTRDNMSKLRELRPKLRCQLLCGLRLVCVCNFSPSKVKFIQYEMLCDHWACIFRFVCSRRTMWILEFTKEPHHMTREGWINNQQMNVFIHNTNKQADNSCIIMAMIILIQPFAN